MRKLKRKMFFTLFFVLMLLAGVLTFFMDYREYADQQNSLREQMVKINGAIERLRSQELFPIMVRESTDVQTYEEEDEAQTDEEDLDDDDIDVLPQGEANIYMFSEYPIYTIFLNRAGQVQRVAFFNTDGDGWENALEKAQKVAATRSPGQMEIGNLFEDHYVWYYGGPSTITLMDIREVNEDMDRMLWFSIPVFLLEVAVIFFISRRLTNWMIQPIEATFEKQKQFIADASHELKTPLAVIMASAEAMEKDHNPKWLKNIEFESDRMNALIKSLLDLTRSEQEGLTLSKVDLSFLAEKEISIQEAVMFEKGIRLESDIPTDVFVLGQNEMVEKVIEILLDNALCHAKDQIWVSLEKKGSQAILRVENNGDLIPESEREKIFERFYRSDSARNRKENRYGLGLAIARNLMTRMGGTIGAEEREGRTSFYLKFKVFNG